METDSHKNYDEQKIVTAHPLNVSFQDLYVYLGYPQVFFIATCCPNIFRLGLLCKQRLPEYNKSYKMRNGLSVLYIKQ